MVIAMQMLPKFKSEFARALRNFQYERTDLGVVFPKQKLVIGGVFSASVDGGPMIVGNNTLALQCLDSMLSVYFDNQAAPVAFYVAPFTNNIAPTSALTAATFTATQGEYTGYTQAARTAWTPNGASSGQTVSNSASPALFTVGASAATVAGAGLLTASAKGATTGVLVAAALFATPNALNPGSSLSIQYSLAATAV